MGGVHFVAPLEFYNRIGIKITAIFWFTFVKHYPTRTRKKTKAQ